MKLVREKYVSYPVRVFPFIVLEENKRSNASQLFDLQSSLFQNFSRSALLSSLLWLEFSAGRIPFAGPEEARVLFQQQNLVVVNDEAESRVKSQLDNSGIASLFQQDDGLRKVTT